MYEELKEYTTFRLGGVCREVASATSIANAQAMVEKWTTEGRAWRVMGGGSNLLVADEGLPEISVLRWCMEAAPSSETVRKEPAGILTVAAGMKLDALVAYACERGWGGLEMFSGIPGTVGGGICGNAGAFGQAIGDRVVSVEVWSPEHGTHQRSGEELNFGYRTSRLQKENQVVLGARIRVENRMTTDLQKCREDILRLRAEKHPDVRRMGTAGSFFKNLPPETPGAQRRAAGALLEQVGAKTMREGGAHVYEKHANIVVADADATAQDVRRLAQRLQEAVAERFGVQLESEVRFWPEPAKSGGLNV